MVNGFVDSRQVNASNGFVASVRRGGVERAHGGGVVRAHGDRAEMRSSRLPVKPER